MDHRLDTLPADALDAVGCFLTGWDLFQLSHVNAQCLQHFAQSEVWQRRLPRDTVGNDKRAYAHARSFLFQGLSLDERLSHCGGTDGSGGAVVQHPLTRDALTQHFTARSDFTLETWFSLLDGERNGVLTGGVLLGAQSPLMRTCTWTNHHVAFMAVDADRNLYCSLLDDVGCCVATELEFGRWYHLAVAYNRGDQRVYLDGELVSENEGSLQRAWLELSQVQVGTGFVSSFWRQKPGLHFDTRPRGVRTFCGWHNFYGLVDEFRVWQQALSAEDVRGLATCQGVQSSPWYSLQRDAQQLHDAHATRLKLVSTTRPTEHTAERYSFSRPSWKLDATLLGCWQSLRAYFGNFPSAIVTK